MGFYPFEWRLLLSAHKSHFRLPYANAVKSIFPSQQWPVTTVLGITHLVHANFIHDFHKWSKTQVNLAKLNLNEQNESNKT